MSLITRGSLAAVAAFVLTASTPRAEDLSYHRRMQIDRIVMNYEASLAAEAYVRCVIIDDLSILFHPDTEPDRVREVLLALPEPEIATYQAFRRWSNTSANGDVPERTPFLLRYSFVPDGTAIQPALAGESNAPSSLFTRMNPAFGGNEEVWKNVFRQAIESWSGYTPISYVEFTDDGAVMPTSPGSGTRGDVRIGMHPVDGPFNVLAYNYFPNNGDMIMDADDVDFFRNTTNNYRLLFNTVAHEHGHGLGFRHVSPTNQTKLMEPSVSGAFEGIQQDEIRGATFLYGDFFEANNGFSSARFVGNLPTPVGSAPSNGVLPFAALEDQNAIDFYRFSVPVTGNLTITVRPLGTTYEVGPQDEPFFPLNAAAMQDIHIELRSMGNSILRTASSNPIGQPETIADHPVDAGDYILVVRSAGGEPGQSQIYSIEFDLTPGSGDPWRRLQWEYETSSESWNFFPVPPLNASSGQHVPGSSPGGTLRIRSAGTGSFGFWESPWISTLAFGQSPAPGDLGVRRPESPYMGANLWKLKAQVQSDAPARNLAPTLRIRTLSRDFDMADVFSIEPVGNADLSPQAGQTREYTFYFHTPTHEPGFLLAFDLLSAPGLPNTTNDLRLTKLEIEPVTVSGPITVTDHRTWDFTTGAEGWDFRTPPSTVFTLPTSTIGGGELGIVPSPFLPGQPQEQFGWWNSPEADGVIIQPGRFYWAEFTVRSDSSNADVVPSFRLRLNELGFQAAALKQVSSNFRPGGSAQTTPTTTPRTYRVFFPRDAAVGRVMFPSFDLLTTQPDNDSTSVRLFLDRVRIWSIPVSAVD